MQKVEKGRGRPTWSLMGDKNYFSLTSKCFNTQLVKETEENVSQRFILVVNLSDTSVWLFYLLVVIAILHVNFSWCTFLQLNWSDRFGELFRSHISFSFFRYKILCRILVFHASLMKKIPLLSTSHGKSNRKKPKLRHFVL